jgi:hypothetical protein
VFYDKNQSFFRFFFREGKGLTLGFLEREGESIFVGGEERRLGFNFIICHNFKM